MSEDLDSLSVLGYGRLLKMEKQRDDGESLFLFCRAVLLRSPEISEVPVNYRDTVKDLGREMELADAVEGVVRVTGRLPWNWIASYQFDYRADLPLMRRIKAIALLSDDLGKLRSCVAMGTWSRTFPDANALREAISEIASAINVSSPLRLTGPWRSVADYLHDGNEPPHIT